MSETIAQRFLVTGGAGFIGSHLTEALVAQGHFVRVLDNLCTGNSENLAQCRDQIEFINGDIRDWETVKKAVEGIDTVFHHAALASVNQSFQEPLLTHEVNVTGTLTVLEACRQAGVKKVIFVSSAAVYNPYPLEPKKELDGAIMPTSPYGLSKRIGEEYCMLYSQTYGLNTICLRYFNVFGSRQNAQSPYSGVISIFLSRALEKQPLLMYGDGLQSRDFIHVSDIVRANLAAMKHGESGIYNIGTGMPHTLQDLVSFLNRQMPAPVAIEHREDRRGDVRHSQADTGNTREKLGFETQTNLNDGLMEVLAWLKTTLSEETNTI